MKISLILRNIAPVLVSRRQEEKYRVQVNPYNAHSSQHILSANWGRSKSV